MVSTSHICRILLLAVVLDIGSCGNGHVPAPESEACVGKGVQLTQSTLKDHTFWITKKKLVTGMARTKHPFLTFIVGWADGTKGHMKAFDCKDFEVKTKGVSEIEFVCLHSQGSVLGRKSVIVTKNDGNNKQWTLTRIEQSFFKCAEVVITLYKRKKVLKARAMTIKACGSTCAQRTSSGQLEASAYFPTVPAVQWSPGTRVRYVCMTPNYEVDGCSTSTCQDSGEWDCPVPQCIPTNCEPWPITGDILGMSQNITHGPLGDWTVETCIHSDCEGPLTVMPIGSELACCQSNGTWDNPAPTHCFD